MRDYWIYTVKELKEILRSRDLPVSGRKSVLIDRLEEWDSKYLFAGEDINITENVRKNTRLKPNVFIHPDSFGGYAFMDFTAALIGEKYQDKKRHKRTETFGTNWDVRSANEAIDILVSEVQKWKDKPYIKWVKINEALFVSPTAWGEETRSV